LSTAHGQNGQFAQNPRSRFSFGLLPFSYFGILAIERSSKIVRVSCPKIEVASEIQQPFRFGKPNYPPNQSGKWQEHKRRNDTPAAHLSGRALVSASVSERLRLNQPVVISKQRFQIQPAFRSAP
jgi:hypothetical protein